MELVEVARVLYALPPEEFTAARTARSREARAAGHRGLAARIAELRKPSAAAWEVDRLVREDPDRVRALLDLGARMARAQRDLAGAELRTLGREQHRLIGDTRDALLQSASGAGRSLSDTVLGQVEGTLRAAMADDAAAAAVATGLLVTHLTSTGLEPVSTDGAVAVPDAPPLLTDAAGRATGAPDDAVEAAPAGGSADEASGDDVVVLPGARRPPPRGPRPARRAAGTDEAADGSEPADGRAEEPVTLPGATRPRRRPAGAGRRARSGAAAADQGAREPERRREDERRDAARVDAEEALATAQEGAARAQDALEAATLSAREAADHEAELARTVDELAERLATAQREHAAARVALRHAEADRRAAAREATTAAGRVARARDRLDGLGTGTS